MRTVVLWNLLALLCLCTLVHGHTLGRVSSTSDLAQLKSLLERFEETLAEVAQEETSEPDYDGTNQGSDQNRAGQPWSLDQTADQEPLKSGRFQSPADGHSNAARQRSRLQDLLMSTRASSCFGARMDRIGNASGLGCNNGRG